MGNTLNKDKQIEEIARALGEGRNQNCEHYVSCSACPCDFCCIFQENAHILVQEGYRKSSEVAREIIGEIEQAQTEIANRMQEFINEWKQYSESTVDYFGGKYESMEVALSLVKSILTDKNAELKNKYTEVGK